MALIEQAIIQAESELEQIDDSNGEVSPAVERLQKIHLQACDWPNWRNDLAALAEPLARASRDQEMLIGRLANIGMALRDQASPAALTDDVLKTSEPVGMEPLTCSFISVDNRPATVARENVSLAAVHFGFSANWPHSRKCLAFRFIGLLLRMLFPSGFFFLRTLTQPSRSSIVFHDFSVSAYGVCMAVFCLYCLIRAFAAGLRLELIEDGLIYSGILSTTVVIRHE